MSSEDKSILLEYLPKKSVGWVYQWIVKYKIQLKITRNRRTKLGDYRPPIHHPNHRISINHNLNPYSFLITFIHELAHLQVFEKHGNKVKPHGKEWKNTYRKLTLEILKEDVFPADIEEVLERSVVNAKASSIADLKLSRVLMKYDAGSTGKRLEDLPLHSIFETERGLHFKKGEKRRTRYKCLNLQNKRFYLFHPLTPVKKVNE